MSEFNEEDSKVKQLYDGSYQLEQKLADGSTQLSNFTKDSVVIENNGGVSSLDLENGVFNFAALKALDVGSFTRMERRFEDNAEIHRYFFAEDSWADIKYKDGTVQDVKTNNVGMVISEQGEKLTITAPQAK
jgi:hypothetical protein